MTPITMSACWEGKGRRTGENKHEGETDNVGEEMSVAEINVLRNVYLQQHR